MIYIHNHHSINIYNKKLFIIYKLNHSNYKLNFNRSFDLVGGQFLAIQSKVKIITLFYYF
jgi:hypothetical protein